MFGRSCRCIPQGRLQSVVRKPLREDPVQGELLGMVKANGQASAEPAVLILDHTSRRPAPLNCTQFL